MKERNRWNEYADFNGRTDQSGYAKSAMLTWQGVYWAYHSLDKNRREFWWKNHKNNTVKVVMLLNDEEYELCEDAMKILLS